MTKPLFESINSRTVNSFSIRKVEQESFSTPYHYHPEYELTLINKGSGKRYIGDHMGQFDNGDLVFLGPNLPHCWKIDSSARGEMKTYPIVVQFTDNFLGEDFFNKPELLEIRKLLERSRRGIVYDRSLIPQISWDLENLAKEKAGFKKLHIFLEILHKLSVNSDFILLNHSGYIPAQNRSDLERINKVFAYIIDNYKTNVSLDEVAQLACMTPNAFCKYFKKVTQKTFIEVVVEYRLHYASNQLLNTNKPVSQICFDCGFNDIVYFTRMFKSKMQVSPLQYKKNFLKTFEVFDELNYSDALPAKTAVLSIVPEEPWMLTAPARHKLNQLCPKQQPGD